MTINTELQIPNVDTLYTNLKGRKGLRTAKPKSPLEAYIWRMVRFHGGIDTHMPVTADWDLDDYIVAKHFNNKKPNFAAEGYKGNDEEIYLWNTFTSLKKEYSNKLESIIDQLCIKFQLNPYKAAMVWGKALGYL